MESRDILRLALYKEEASKDLYLDLLNLYAAGDEQDIEIVNLFVFLIQQKDKTTVFLENKIKHFDSLRV